MKNTSPILSVILSFVLALIYLASGIAKAADINAFADIIVLYGFPKLHLLAPIITFLEISLGFALLFLWKIRKVALFSFCFISFLSIIFTYGFLFLGIEDCGCMGSFYLLPVWVSITRNLFMVFISYWLYQ